MTTAASIKNQILAPRESRIAANILWAINSIVTIWKRAFCPQEVDKTSYGVSFLAQCIGRILIFALPLLVELVPQLGSLIGSGFLAAIGLVELIVILTINQCAGDMIADIEVQRERAVKNDDQTVSVITSNLSQ